MTVERDKNGRVKRSLYERVKISLQIFGESAVDAILYPRYGDKGQYATYEQYLKAEGDKIKKKKVEKENSTDWNEFWFWLFAFWALGSTRKDRDD